MAPCIVLICDTLKLRYLYNQDTLFSPAVIHNYYTDELETLPVQCLCSHVLGVIFDPALRCYHCYSQECLVATLEDHSCTALAEEALPTFTLHLTPTTDLPFLIPLKILTKCRKWTMAELCVWLVMSNEHQYTVGPLINVRDTFLGHECSLSYTVDFICV